MASIVAKQKALGIDIPDDGEHGKPSCVSYANDRLGGFTPREQKGETRSPVVRLARGADISGLLRRAACRRVVDRTSASSAPVR